MKLKVLLSVFVVSQVIVSAASAAGTCTRNPVCMNAELADALGFLENAETIQGYQVELHLDAEAPFASVEYVTFFKEKKLRAYRQLERVPCTQKKFGTWFCVDSTVVDKGFQIEFKADVAGVVTQAVLVERQFAGPVQHGTLECQR